MQIKHLAAAIAASLVSAPLFAQAPVAPVMQGTVGMAPEAEVAPAARTADQWVARMADFTKNAQAFKDPVVFAHWMNAMTDPSMVAAMTEGMLEPGNWLHMMTSMMQPAAVSNYAQFMIDPMIYARWGAAMLDPMWYTKLIADATNPRKIMGWMMLPMDPRLMSASTKMLDPNLYLKFMMMPTDPRGMALMFAPMNPQLYGSMMGGLVNPKLVGGAGSTWGSFMYPTQPVVSLQPRAPLELPINLMDPKTYGNVLNIIPGLPSLPSLTGGQGGAAQGAAAPFPFNLIPSLPATPGTAAPAASGATAPAAMPFPFNLIPSLPATPGTAAPAASGATAPTAMPFPFNILPAAPGTGQTAAQVAPAAAAKPAAQPAPAGFAVQAGTASTLNLGGDALFNTGKSSINDLTAEGRAKLDDLVAKIKTFGAIDSIKVIGHADKMGKPAANQKLSLERAKAVTAYLKSKDVKAKYFTTAGLGDSKPVVDCDMKLAKDALKTCLAPNRRVEIEVTGAARK